MWANNCPAGLLKNKKKYTFVFFVPENNVNLQSILMGRGIGHKQFEAVYTQYYARFVIIARRYVRDVAWRKT